MTLATLTIRDGSAVQLLRATGVDVAEIVGLLAGDAIARTRGDSASPADGEAYAQAFARIDADPAQLLAIGRSAAGAAVAACQLTFIPVLSRLGATRLQIEAVRVADSHRGTGRGSSMINWALDEGRRRGATLAQLTSDRDRTDAHRFYLRLGFVPSHEGFKYAL